MARMPGTIWQGEHGGSLMTRYDIVCVHTIVGYAPAHAAHFSVRGDGTILQSRDTRYKSAANLNGNHRVISIENEDHGPHFPGYSGSSNVPALTPAQVAANARILRWAHETHGVPLQLCPNSRPGSRGLAYHRQGCDGNFTDGYPGRVSGGELWTKSYGKICPGTQRISQLPAILAAASGTVITPLEDDVTPEQAAQIDKIERRLDVVYEAFRMKAAQPELSWSGNLPGRVDALYDARGQFVNRDEPAATQIVKGDAKPTWYVVGANGKRPAPDRAHVNFLVELGLADARPQDANGDYQPHIRPQAELDRIPSVDSTPDPES